jgi:hypothetical protein
MHRWEMRNQSSRVDRAILLREMKAAASVPTDQRSNNQQTMVPADRAYHFLNPPHDST